jgi:hypothetical protein
MSSIIIAAFHSPPRQWEYTTIPGIAVLDEMPFGGTIVGGEPSFEQAISLPEISLLSDE